MKLEIFVAGQRQMILSIFQIPPQKVSPQAPRDNDPLFITNRLKDSFHKSLCTCFAEKVCGAVALGQPIKTQNSGSIPGGFAIPTSDVGIFLSYLNFSCTAITNYNPQPFPRELKCEAVKIRKSSVSVSVYSQCQQGPAIFEKLVLLQGFKKLAIPMKL